MDKIKILLVEDEKNISDIIKAYLLREGYEVSLAEDGQEALDLFDQEDFHLLILDLMLPKLSGEEVCAEIRTRSDLPIIMLTAKAQEEDTIQGLALGADDYITKPFSPRELLGRVKAVLRRAYRDLSPLAERLSFNKGDLEVDVDRMLVRKKGEDLALTSNEFKILLALLSNPGQVLSREQLIERAFGYDYEGFDRTVDTHIKNIRQKIEDNPRKPDYILTVYGMGYRFGGVQ